MNAGLIALVKTPQAIGGINGQLPRGGLLSVLENSCTLSGST